MAGTNLNSATTATSPTLWIREVQPTPAGTKDQALAISATCTGSPPTTADTFAHGCLMLQQDTSTGTNALYQNTGSATSVVWTLLDTSLGGPATSLVDSNQVTALDVGTTASAVNNLRVTDAATGNAPKLSAVGTDTNISVIVAGKGTGAVELGQATSTGVQLLADQPIVDSSGNTYVAFVKTASAVNGITVTNSATANPPTLTATGSDTNISFNIAPKGTGGMIIGSTTGTSDMVLGSSSGVQSVKLANGAGAATVNVANVSTAGSTITMAGAATAGTASDTIALATGNAASTAKKIVNIATGTPNTSGNNQVTIGGGTTSAVTTNAVVTSYQAFNQTTGSAAANAPVATLNNSAGSTITVATGLRITLTLAAGLQAGANTLNLNSHGTDSIKKHTNPATDLSTAYATGGVIDLYFNGTVWLDMSQ